MPQVAFCRARGTAAMSVRQLGRSELGQSRRSRRAERRRTLAGERHHPVVRRSLFNRGVMLTRKG
jgi:hypothetical protein